MKILELRVINFRNLADVRVPLGHGTVIVGQNRAGKSNLIQALRLLLDPTLSSYDRTLQRDDFWEGLSDGTTNWDPFAAGCQIEVTALISDLDDEPKALAAFGSGVVSSNPLTAKIAYRFAPREDIKQPEVGPKAYGWSITAGENDERVGAELRGFLAHRHLSALRDVESDLASWRGSPLRGLVETAVSKIESESLDGVAESFKTASNALTELEPIAQLGNDIGDESEHFSGSLHALDVTLAVTPPDPLRILRGLKVYLDGDAQRSLSSASLGGLNILYLSLVQLLSQDKIRSGEIAHSILSIEEPEAHLHPHTQRVVFSRLASGNDSISTIVTTHSPHIVSVTPPNQLVVMRPDGSGSTAFAAREADLSEPEWDDVGRYLDATRGELVFAKKVLLVEGFGEQVLMPFLANQVDMSLDSIGVTVCAIHGTHFDVYAKLLTQLRIPWAVITDGDPRGGDPEDLAGTDRAARILRSIEEKAPEGWEPGQVFVGLHTLERDIFETSTTNSGVCVSALAELMPSIDARETMEADVFMAKVKSRKGRFAQKLAAMESKVEVPGYISEALNYLGRR